MSEHNLRGLHKQGYATTLKEANPEKKQKDDWWAELCKKHGAKNHFPKDKPVKESEEKNDGNTEK